MIEVCSDKAVRHPVQKMDSLRAWIDIGTIGRVFPNKGVHHNMLVLVRPSAIKAAPPPTWSNAQPVLLSPVKANRFQAGEIRDIISTQAAQELCYDPS